MAAKINPRKDPYLKANRLFNQDKFEQALKVLDTILKKQPDHAGATHLMGAIQFHQGHIEAAQAYIEKATSLDDTQHEWFKNLAVVYLHQKAHAQAAKAAHQAVTLKPDYHAGYSLLGDALSALNDMNNAIIAYAKAINFDQSSATTHDRLANCLNKIGKTDQAINVQLTALKLAENSTPEDQSKLCLNLASFYHKIGLVDEAIHYLNQAVQLDPNSPSTHSALIATLIYRYDFDEQIFANYLLYSARHALPYASEIKPHSNNPDPNRKLKIGYVSADFYHHAVAFYITPILEQHDREQFEIYCYYNNTVNDSVTDKIKTLADHWQPCVHLDDSQLAEQIRRDSIDILVDLSGHTVGNRLPVFARKPAPVQISYIGFPTTTGLTTMDYILLPDEAVTNYARSYFSETIIPDHISGTFSPPNITLPVNELPALKNGHITFASFNRPYKISKQVIELWSRVLAAVPDSKLLLHIGAIGSDVINQLYLERFERYGIDRSRIRFHPLLPTYEYLKAHHTVDICLDTFPYSGATTTLISLWMGVPVITLKGIMPYSNTTAMYLDIVNLEDFIANSEDEYINLAKRLSENPGNLSRVRTTIRDKLRISKICTNSTELSLHVVFRNAWINWCLKN